MTTVYLALGSNVGDSRTYIAQATELLRKKLGSMKCAPLYTSQAVGYTDQPDFINTAICGKTSLSPQELLNFTKATEQQIGRVERFRWGPREIDIDIIFYGDTVLQTPDLTIPHPLFHERDFVLQPLCDLDPQLIDPASKRSVQQLLDELPSNQKSALQRIDEN